MTAALILFAHGSRDPQWAAPFRAVQKKLASMRPRVTVELAFLEMMQPSLPEALERVVSAGHATITIAPLFMAQGAHLKRDLAKLVADAKARHRGVDIHMLPAAGEAEAVLDAMSDWVASHV